MPNNFTTLNLNAAEQIRLINVGAIDADNITQAQLDDLVATLEDMQSEGKELVESMNKIGEVFEELEELESELDTHFDSDKPLNYEEVQAHFTAINELHENYTS